MSIEKLAAIWPEWKIIEQIGEGSFGKVYKAVREEHTMTTYAAIKVISIPQSDTELSSLRSEGLTEDASKTYFEGVVNDFVNEIKLMESMKGTSNVVSVEDFRVLEKDDKIGWDIFIRMELLKPFNEYISEHTMTEQEVIKLGTDICTALELCSRRNIIHRDIKPENIFISSFGDFKVGDFGIAKELEKTSGAMSSKGTYNYMAPEIAAGKKYDYTVDIYSLGLVLYKLLNNNRLPFIDPYAQQIQYQDRKDATDRRLRGEPLPPPVNASPQMAEIILAACSYEPSERFSSPTAFKSALLSINNADFVPPKPISNAKKIDLDATTAARPAPVSSQANQYAAQVQSFDKPKKQPKPKMSKGKKAKIILITIAVAIVVLAIALASFFFTSPAYNVYSKMKSEKYADALSKYNEEVDDNFIQETLLNILLKDRADEVVTKFKNGEIEYNSAVEELNTLEKMGFAGSKDKIGEITTINEADNALSAGDQYYESGDYENAIKEYSKVPESDENYDAAQSKLTELYPKYIGSVVETVQKYNSSKQYKEALSYVNTAYDILPEGVDTSELDKAKNESLSEYKSDIMREVTDLINDSKYKEALNLLDEAIAVDGNEDFRNTKTTTEGKYVESITDTVQKHLDDEDYISAARVVDNALTDLPDNSDLKSLKEKVKNETPTYLLDVCKPYQTSEKYTEYINGEKAIIGGSELTNGFSVEGSGGTAIFNIDSKYTVLGFSVGHVAGTNYDDASIKVYLDGDLSKTYELSHEDLAKRISLDVTGVKQIKFLVEAHGNQGTYWVSYGFGNVTVK